MHWANEYLIGVLIVALSVVSGKVCMSGIPVLAKLAYSHDNQVQFMLGWSKYFYVIQIYSRNEVGMYTAERQRAQPYLEQVSGPLFEQWFLLHP
jgi:hypothetical protein